MWTTTTKNRSISKPVVNKTFITENNLKNYYPKHVKTANIVLVIWVRKKSSLTSESNVAQLNSLRGGME